MVSLAERISRISLREEFLFGALLFLLVAFSERIALVFLFLLVFVVFSMSQNDSIARLLKAPKMPFITQITMGALGAAAILGLTLVVTPLVGGVAGFLDVFRVFANASSPQFFFESSAILSFVAFGIVAPIVETRLFFGSFYGLLGDAAKKFNINIGTPGKANLFSIANMIYATTLGIIFVLFHLTVRWLQTGGAPLEFTLALVGVFIFGAVSTYMVHIFGNTRQAEWTHIIWNSAVLLGTQATLLGTLTFGLLA